MHNLIQHVHIFFSLVMIKSFIHVRDENGQTFTTFFCIIIFNTMTHKEYGKPTQKCKYHSQGVQLLLTLGLLQIQRTIGFEKTEG